MVTKPKFGGWSDNASTFHSDLNLKFIEGAWEQHEVNFVLNFFEAGDGKNDLDAHFGTAKGIESRFLVQFESIQGLFDFQNCISTHTINRNRSVS